VLRNSAVDVDAGDLRALLRAGPFRKFRDSMRSLARLQAQPDASAQDTEAVFRALETLDATLLRLVTADAAAAPQLRADAAAQIGQALVALDAVLAKVQADTLAAARAQLQ
jgi:hypothetical protein